VDGAGAGLGNIGRVSPVPTEHATLPQADRPQAVTDRIRIAVLSGTLLPGEPLEEASLGEWLGADTPLVREALAELTGEGLVRADHDGRRTVAPLDRESALAIIDLVKAVSLTAITWSLANITDDDIAALREASDNFASALEAGAVEEAVGEVDRFWQLLFRAARNSALDEILESVRTKMIRVVWLYSAASAYGAYLDDHRGNMEDIERRDASALIARLGRRLDAMRALIAEADDAPWASTA
jgi:DNA-binding GntR family transcriptional regulator